MNPERRSTPSLALSVGAPFCFQVIAEAQAAKTATQCLGAADRTQSDMVIAVPEAHFVAWIDAEPFAHLLGDHHLAFGTHRTSHTSKYNLLIGIRHHGRAW